MSCCPDWLLALQEGTDHEGYGRALRAEGGPGEFKAGSEYGPPEVGWYITSWNTRSEIRHGKTEWSILRPARINFCPWCGAKVKSPTSKDFEQ